MLQDHREKLIENKNRKNKLFLQLMGKYTISNIKRLYPWGPLLSKFYIHDIFLMLKITYFTEYADGSMPFVVGDDTTNSLKTIEYINKSPKIVFK